MIRKEKKRVPESIAFAPVPSLSLSFSASNHHLPFIFLSFLLIIATFQLLPFHYYSSNSFIHSQTHTHTYSLSPVWVDLRVVRKSTLTKVPGPKTKTNASFPTSPNTVKAVGDLFLKLLVYLISFCLFHSYFDEVRDIHYVCVSSSIGLLRCGKSCRLRWINYLRPDLKRGNFTDEEDHLIINLHSLLGNKYVFYIFIF